jgi:hypothetical protein
VQFVCSVYTNLHLFKADFIFGNSHKSFGAKSGELSGCFISFGPEAA